MLGANDISEIGVQKQAPGFDRKISPFPLPCPSASLAMCSDAGFPDSNETFRQKWQAIVSALHVSDKNGGTCAPSADLMRETSVNKADGESVAKDKNKSPATNNQVAWVADNNVSVATSMADLSEHQSVMHLQTLRILDSTHVQPSHLSTRGRAKESTLHSPKSSPKDDPSAQKQVAQIQPVNVSAPDSLLTISPLTALQPGIQLATGSKPHMSLSAPDLVHGKGNSATHQDVEQESSAHRVISSTVQPSPSEGITGAEAASQQASAPASFDSHPSTMATNRGSDDASDLVSTQVPKTGLEQERRPVSHGQSIRPIVGHLESTSTASEKSMKSDSVADAAFDRRTESMLSSAGPLKKQPFGHDQTDVHEALPSSPAKNATAPHISNDSVPNPSVVAFGQTHSNLATPASAAGTQSPGLDTPSATEEKRANEGEPFAAIDAGMNEGAARWIHADSHRAEAGFQDPSLGWVSVRAQAGAEGIHAAVMAPTDAAAQVLSGHLAGLNAHMASHYGHVNATTVSTPGEGWNGPGTAGERPQGNGNAPNHGSQRQTQDDSGRALSGSVREHSRRRLEEATTREVPVFPANMMSRDRHISVVV